MQTIQAAVDAARIAAEAARAIVTYVEEIKMEFSAAKDAHNIVVAATNTNDASTTTLQLERVAKTATDVARLAQAQFQVAKEKCKHTLGEHTLGEHWGVVYHICIDLF